MSTTKSPAKTPAQKTGEPAEAGVRKTYTIDLDPTRTIGLPDNPGEMSYGQLDQIVREGSLVFAVTGVALAEIKKRALWKETHPTWANYCKARIGSSASKADRLISSAKVMTDLTPIGGNLLPACESQARPLAKLKTAENRLAVWKNLVDEAGAPPTAEQVKGAVEKFLAAKADPPPADAGGECEPEVVPEDAPEGAPEDAPEVVPEDAPEDAPEVVPGDALDTEEVEDQAADHPDTGVDAGLELGDDDEPGPEDGAAPEPAPDAGQTFELAGGEPMALPSWVDGVITPEMVGKGLKALAKMPNMPDLNIAQRCLILLSASLNAETASLARREAKTSVNQIGSCLRKMTN